MDAPVRGIPGRPPLSAQSWGRVRSPGPVLANWTIGDRASERGAGRGSGESTHVRVCEGEEEEDS